MFNKFFSDCRYILGPHHVWKYMVNIRAAAAEIRRGKKRQKKKKKERNHRAKIYWTALFHRAAIIKSDQLPTDT